VEEEAALRNVCRVYLESKGYTVLGVGNAKEAMTICQSHDLPIRSDHGHCDAWSGRIGIGQIRIVNAASAFRCSCVRNTDRLLDPEAISFAKFLQKPFSFDALARAVKSLLDNNREILLAEDSKFMRVAIQSALTGAGYTVQTANHSEADLRAARETLPDLILLDLLLPKISGLAVLRALKQDALTKSIPLVVLAVLSETTEEELLNEGAAVCVEKSASLLEKGSAALVQTVSQVVGKARAKNG
jgi:CheY-like chemotaxis protein